ncbi:endospore coat-associated protein YheD [Paenibacillus lautus]|uniref:YheC/YheD family endospore coat-associated protein n=1 Tax=Paenibacillus lautus TaxID=1401 RepID=UPI001B16069A|nr:YheC/YheD family protein [Paenibacillus lautus]GIO95534.1 endospore coat-associated protein YheD [Paenibacillus lautus]
MRKSKIKSNTKSKISAQLIRSAQLSDNDIKLGDRLIRQLRIPTDSKVQLAFGSFKQEVSVTSGGKSNSLTLSPSVFSHSGLLPRTVMNVKYYPTERTLKLGPLIGIMVSRYQPDEPDKPFGSISAFCLEMVNAAKKQGAYVYFFTPDMIGSNPATLEAIAYDAGWKKLSVPAPDVINNRLSTRKLENSPSVQHFMREVKSRFGTHIFNEKFLDKSDVFEALGPDAKLQKYLPESYLLSGYPTLKKMCAAYRTVFLKPVRGSLGKGIIRISRQENGHYQTMTTSLEGSNKNTYSSLPKLFSSLSGKIKKRRYQIQQGLDLIRINRRNVDFRALVHKDKNGKWAVTSVVARIAGGNHFVSNLARGGTLSSVKDALAMSSIPLNSKQTAPARMNQAALDIAHGLEAAIPYHFGELGIDLAIDTTGRIWLLEVNSKPSKGENAPLNADSKVRPSAVRLVQYCQYLTGF